jgi:hypothetical protein
MSCRIETQVSLEVGALALGGADEQGAGVRQHDRGVFDVPDAAYWEEPRDVPSCPQKLIERPRW